MSSPKKYRDILSKNLVITGKCVLLATNNTQKLQTKRNIKT